MFSKTLLKCKESLDNIGVTFWLDCGTALGFYRENKFIDHDKDIDVSIMIKDYTLNIKKSFEKHGFMFLHQFGLPSNGLEMSFILPDTFSPKLDIFYFYENPDYYWRSSYSCDNWAAYFEDKRPWLQKKTKLQQYNTYFTKFELLNVIFIGQSFHIPPITYIEELYGQDWKIPKTTNYLNNAISTAV